MKLALVLMFLIVSAYAAPQMLPAYKMDGDQSSNEQVEDVVLEDDGSFTLRFVNADGTMVQEEGILMIDEQTGEDNILVKKGTYAYMDDNGKPVNLIYDANQPGDIEIN